MMENNLNIRLVLVRHGRAGGNARHILNGVRRDSPLTRLGRAQAKALAKSWKERPDVILTSPLKRARQTAYYFEKKYGIKATALGLLSEQDCGDWSGHCARVILEKHPERFFPYEDGRRSHFLKSVPDGESWEEVVGRARRFLKMVKEGYRGKKLLVVSHGVFIIACTSLLSGIRPPRLWECRLKNADGVRFEL